MLDSLIRLRLGAFNEFRPVLLGRLQDGFPFGLDFLTCLRETAFLQLCSFFFGLPSDLGGTFPSLGEAVVTFGFRSRDRLFGLGLGSLNPLENLLAGHSSPEACCRLYKGVAKRPPIDPPTASLCTKRHYPNPMGILEDKDRARVFYRYLSTVYDQVNKLVWTTEMRDDALSMLDIGPEDRVLDVGCGTGFATEGLLKYTANVVGLDQSVDQLEQAWEKLGKHDPVVFNLGDAERLPFTDDSFDLVWSSGSIEYWPAPVEALRELRRVARPGGQVLVVGPNAPQNRVARRLADAIMLFYDEGEADRMFESAGYTDVTHRVMGPSHWPNAAIVSLATLPDG